MNKFQYSSCFGKPMLADVIVLGRVSTSIKAGIPAHVLSIIESLADHKIKLINVVPSLTISRASLNPFGYSERQISQFSTEILCSSFLVYKTLGLSFSFFYNYYRIAYDNPSAPVHLHLPDPLSILTLLFCKKRKIIATLHADLLNKGPFSFLYNQLLKKFSLKSNVVFVVPTPAHIRGTILNKLQHRPLILPFIFKDKPISSSGQILLNNTYSSEETRFLFVGRHVPYKGINVAIQAFMQLSHSLNCVFDIVGHGPLTSFLRVLAADNRRIHFWGELSDEELELYYLKSHVFVLPSVTQAEAFGIVQVEAMLHHCLCLSSFLDNGVNYVNQEGVSGHNFPVNDVDALSQLMHRYCTNIGQRNQLMASAREYAYNTFASNDLCQSYLNLYLTH
jgi:rhamnosyl/mannosyltransferase